MREFVATVIPISGGTQAVTIKAYTVSDARKRLEAMGYAVISIA